MNDRTATPETFPADGGSYERLPDGTLRQLEPPTAPPPGKSAQAASKAADAPVSRGSRPRNTPAE